MVLALVLKLLLKQTRLCNRILILMLDFETKVFSFWNYYVHAHSYAFFFSPHICMNTMTSFTIFSYFLAPSYACTYPLDNGD